jgi:hypothetical protein
MTQALEQALIEALDDEYKASATYAHIISIFGEIRPFTNILEAEKRHIQALLPLFEKYGISVPENSWGNRVETPNSILEACQAGIDAEIENAEMYERLLAATQDYADVQQVFKNLQRASQENHLPAFQRCVERGGTDAGRSGAGNTAKGRRGNAGGGKGKGLHGKGHGCR